MNKKTNAAELGELLAKAHMTEGERRLMLRSLPYLSPSRLKLLEKKLKKIVKSEQSLMKKLKKAWEKKP